VVACVFLLAPALERLEATRQDLSEAMVSGDADYRDVAAVHPNAAALQ